MNKVKIYRDGKRYFYTYQNETKELDEISLNKLQTKLKLPFEIIFCNSISLAQRQKIMGRFISEEVNFQIGLTENDEYKVTYTKQKQIVHVYCMPSKINLEGRNENCKPYILTTLGDNKILMEVTKDYILNSNEPYYFIYGELTESERAFFAPVYRRIECDYVYKLAYQEEKNPVLGRRKNRERKII